MSVKLDQELMRRAKTIAASREQSVIEYLESMLRPQIQRDMASHLEEETRKLTGESPAPKRKPKGGNS
ncbi:MAG TPA: hypothetical protein VKA15_14985 [Isosphaeraceae bacterium]|nr:hypothetical protein [Isosphaeraceae bacterium]